MRLCLRTACFPPTRSRAPRHTFSRHDPSSSPGEIKLPGGWVLCLRPFHVAASRLAPQGLTPSTDAQSLFTGTDTGVPLPVQRPSRRPPLATTLHPPPTQDSPTLAPCSNPRPVNPACRKGASLVSGRDRQRRAQSTSIWSVDTQTRFFSCSSRVRYISAARDLSWRQRSRPTSAVEACASGPKSDQRSPSPIADAETTTHLQDYATNPCTSAGAFLLLSFPLLRYPTSYHF
jgi:hypothetical protein